jgi:hypothetical protein
LIFDKQTKSILSYKIMNEAASAANRLPQGVAPSTNGPPQGVAAASNIPANAAAQRKQKAAEEKARREAHLMRLIDNTTWQSPDNFTVEENVLKLIIGFDPAVFNVDMLCKICGKLGFVSRKFTKVVCLETILKAFNDLKAYDGIEANKSTNNIDSTSVRCRLLNVITSDGFVARFQMLGSRKEMAELDKGGAGQDKEFWEDVAIEFNDYGEEDKYGSLLLTSAYNKKVFSDKNVDPSIKARSDKSWDSLRSIYLLIQKDYKKKFERFKTSGTHESNFHDFCHGRLDTYYLHVCLQIRDTNLLEAVVEELPDSITFESMNPTENDNNNNNTISSKQAGAKKKRKSPADV